MDVQVNWKDVCEVLKAQRNAALDEAATLTAVVRVLRAEIIELKKPPQEAGPGA